jgi:competence protein ComEC
MFKQLISTKQGKRYHLIQGGCGFILVLLSFTVWRVLPSTTLSFIICVILWLIYWKLRQSLYLGGILGFFCIFCIVSPWLFLQEYLQTNRVQHLTVKIISVVNHKPIKLYAGPTVTESAKSEKQSAQVGEKAKYLSKHAVIKAVPTSKLVNQPAYITRQQKLSFTVRVSDTSSPLHGQKIKLSWYYKLDNNKTPKLQVGDTWALNIKVKPLHSYRNSGSFDYIRYLLGQNVFATGYVRKGNNHLIRLSVAFREDAIAYMSQSYGEFPWVGALMFGQKVNYDPKSRKQTLIATGTAHLFVISGLHVAIVFGSFLVVGKYCLVKCQWLEPSWQNNLVLFISFLGVLAYAYMAGWTVPVFRATSVCALWVMIQFMHIRIVSSQLLLFALLLLLVISPWSIYQVGFWLSFGSVSCIMLIGWKLQTTSQGIFKKSLYAIKLQVLLSILLIPMTWWVFGQVTLVSMFANLLLIPIFAILVVPLHLLTLSFLLIDYFLETVFSSSLLDTVVMYFLLGCHRALEWCFILLEHLHMPMFVFTKVSYLQMCWMIGVLLIIGLYYLRCWRLLGLGIIILGLGSWFNYHKQHITTFTVLDVGQGSAAIFHRGSSAIIFDVGDAFSPGFNSWKNVLEPYLQSHNITQIEAVYISHNDRDHDGSIPYLLKAFPDTPIFRPLKKTLSHLEHDAKDCSTRQPAKTVFKDSNLVELKLDVLWPNQDTNSNLLKISKNNTSCVISLSVGKDKILIPGDIEFAAEQALLNHYAESSTLQLAHQIMLAPHHGSRTSSHLQFVEAVDPEQVIISSGFLNRWQFPHQKPLTHYRYIGAQISNTAQLGSVSLSWDEAGNFLGTKYYIRDIQPRWYRPYG